MNTVVKLLIPNCLFYLSRETETFESVAEDDQLPQIVDELHDVHVSPGAPMAKLQLRVKGKVINMCDQSSNFQQAITMFLKYFCHPGFPKPRIYWFKDGQPLQASKRILLSTTRDIHAVEVLEVKREDMGEYSAYISNAAGSSYTSARLIVLSMYASTQIQVVNIIQTNTG